MSIPSDQRRSEPPDLGQLAEAVAAVVRAHPAVVDLDGGPFGTIACYLPGRRITGVRIGEPDEPVVVSVIARLGTPLPQLATELRQTITKITGPRAIDLTINDVIGGDPIPTC
jgi:hypothetical protein